MTNIATTSRWPEPARFCTRTYPERIGAANVRERVLPQARTGICGSEHPRKPWLARARTLIISLALCLACVPLLAQHLGKQSPNILLIVSDDQGYADIGCCGRPELKTPNLDRIVREGVRLTSFYVAWPACTPSRGALLTGRYPQRNGLYDMIRNNEVNWDHRFSEAEYAVSPEMTIGLDLREVTIAQQLKSVGYATGIVGKWDSGRARRFLPLQRGFDFFFGFANTGIDYFTHERYGIPSMYRGNDRITEEGYATELFRREAVRFIDFNKDRPFFLYVPFNAPHAASNLDRPGAQATDEYIRMYGTPPGDKRSRYLACITEMDHAIGDILATLEKHGILEETFVFFHSDNGGSGQGLNTPLRGHKAQMFEGGNRVLAMARWPGKIPAGADSDAFLTTVDLFPTFSAIAGAELRSGIHYDGFDLLPVIAGKEKSRREEMYWQRRDDRAARYRNWKWVGSEAGGGLFDLASDIGEQNDLSEAKPEVLRMMKDKWATWRREMDESEPRGPFRDY